MYLMYAFRWQLVKYFKNIIKTRAKKLETGVKNNINNIFCDTLHPQGDSPLEVESK